MKLYRDSDLKLAHIAEQLGVSHASLLKWVQQADADEGRGPADALTTAERAELRRLRKENRELRMVAEILKKAEAFCAENDP